jgi:hypothetical protein
MENMIQVIDYFSSLADLRVRGWEKILKLIRRGFETGRHPEFFCNGILVFIPKSSSDEFSGIALLKTLYMLLLPGVQCI